MITGGGNDRVHHKCCPAFTQQHLHWCDICRKKGMTRVKITAIRRTEYPDLMDIYENPIEDTCDVILGQSWISENGECPVGMCFPAWESMRSFVESLARGEGDFYDGWMKNPMSAMISCNDGFRPVSFYIEALKE